MSDLLVVLAFALMVFSPCLVALHVMLAEEGPDLGYATSLRHLRAVVVDFLRV